MSEIPGPALLTLAGLWLDKTRNAPIAVYADRGFPLSNPSFHEIRNKAGAGFEFWGFAFVFFFN